MSRDWVKRNNNQGNVLKTSYLEVNASQVITPDANITVINVDLLVETTLTGVIDNSIVGDQLILVVENNTAGALDLIAAGDFSSGNLTVAAGGVGSALLVANSQNFASIVAP